MRGTTFTSVGIVVFTLKNGPDLSIQYLQSAHTNPTLDAVDSRGHRLTGQQSDEYQKQLEPTASSARYVRPKERRKKNENTNEWKTRKQTHQPEEFYGTSCTMPGYPVPILAGQAPPV